MKQYYSINSLSDAKQLSIELEKITNDIIAHSSMVEASLGKVPHSKIESSFSGNAIKPLIKASAQLCAIKICRFWGDRNVDNLLNFLSKNLNLLAEQSQNPWSEKDQTEKALTDRLAALRRQHDLLTSSNAYRNIRVFRTEKIAHLLSGESSDRKNFFGNGDFLPPSYNAIIDISKETMGFSKELTSICRRNSIDFKQRYEMQLKYGRMMWDSFPIFRQVENEP